MSRRTRRRSASWLLVPLVLLVVGCKGPTTSSTPAATSQEPLVGKWEMPAGRTKLVWVFAPDGTGRPDVSHLEAQFRTARPGRPLSAKAQQFLEQERAQRFAWSRQGSVYRLESASFEPTPLGRVLFVRVDGNQLRLCSPDGKKTAEDTLLMNRVAGG